MSNIIHVPMQRGSVSPARLLFIGEAPSDEEISHKPPTPLVGPSGRVFNAILRSAGIDRSEVWVTNVFDEQLPDNQVGEWGLGLKEARAAGLTDLPPVGGRFLRAEHRWHLQRLQAEIDEADPFVIVPLGATALWALTGATNITGMRGSPTLAKGPVGEGRKIFPTFHPAHVIHQIKMFPIVVEDLVRARAEAVKGRELIWPSRELWLEPTLADLAEYEPRVLASDLLSIDIETGYGNITSVQFAPSSSTSICIPFADKRQPDKSYWRSVEDEVQAWRFVRRWCESPVPKLGQNFEGYDASWLLRRAGIAVRNLREDTRLLHHALYPELPKSLGFMSAYTEQGAWKVMRGRSADKRDE